MVAEFAWWWVSSSVGSAFLVGLAAYLGRHQLSAWLQKDLEAIKAQHQRDLEAYKVSLIAEAERAKAQQDVRKAAAMFLVEKRFKALDRMHKATSDLAVEVLAATHQPSTEKRKDVQARFIEYRAAHRDIEIFLDGAENGRVLALSVLLMEGLKAANPSASPISAADFAALSTRIFAGAKPVDELISAKVAEMLAMSMPEKADQPTS